MDLPAEKKVQNCIKGLAYACLWYFSIWSGFLFVCCPLWPFILFHPKVFAPIMSTMFTLWEMYPVALMNVIFGTKLHISGDRIDPHEISVIMVNHRTRVDWNFLWALMYYASEPRSHRLKITLKAPLRHTPSLGWVMQVAGCLYIRRKWEQDRITIAKQLDYYFNTERTFQILLFPEGTDLTVGSLRKSNDFAAKTGLKPFSHVLHPRTTGFTHLVDIMRKRRLDAIYDLTLAYEDVIPQTEKDIIVGRFPTKICVNIKRHSVKDLTTDGEELKQWINERWNEKEELMESFAKIRKFTDTAYISSLDSGLQIAFIFWSIVLVLMFYLFFNSIFFFWWSIIHSFLFVTISIASDGFQSVCVTVYEYLFRIKKLQ